MTAPVQPSRARTPYEDFKYRMALRVLQRGGTLDDVQIYLDHLEERGEAAQRAFGAAPEALPEAAPGLVGGLSQQVLQGVTFGFGDEAVGSLYGLVVMGGDAQAGRDIYRASLAAFREQHPVASTAANIGGAALALPAGVAGALGRGGLTAGAAFGAGAGGLAAAGEAEGGLGERLAAAPIGAAGGTLLGSIAGPLTRVVGRGITRAGRAIRGAVGAPEALIARGVRATGETFQRAASRIPGSPASAARRLIADALVKDGKPLGALAREAERRSAQGVPTTLADLGGDHLFGLATTAQQMRGPLQSQFAAALAGRQAGAGERLLTELGKATKVGLRNAYELGDELAAMRLTEADPLYRQAFAETVELTPTLQKMLRSPVWRRAYMEGRAIAQQEDAAGIARGLKVPPLPKKGAPEEEALTMLPVRGLDYMKQGLDNIVEVTARKGKPLPNKIVRALRTRLSEALQEIDAQVPVYGQARATWRGYSESIDALTLGREGFRRKPSEVVAREIAKLRTPTEREMYRIGAIQDISDAVHGLTREDAEVAQKLFGARLFGSKDRTMASRIRALFERPSDADEFLDKVASEASLERARGLARRGVPQERSAAATLGPPGVTTRVLTKVAPLKTGAAGIERARDIANEVTQLLSKGADDPRQLVAMLRQLEQASAAERALVSRARTVAGQQGAALAGGASDRF